MLPPVNRLRKEKEIKRVLAGRRSYKSGLLICKAAPNGLDTARFCFVVSKKISNKAVVRNKLKRRLRSAVKVFLPQIKPGIDCVFIACPGLNLKEYRDLVFYVERILTVLGVLALKNRIP